VPSRSKNTFLIFIIFSLISFISVKGVHAHRGQEKRKETEHEGELCAEFIDKARQSGTENRAEGFDGIERAHDKIAVLALSEHGGFVLNERERNEVEREENDVYDDKGNHARHKDHAQHGNRADRHYADHIEGSVFLFHDPQAQRAVCNERNHAQRGLDHAVIAGGEIELVSQIEIKALFKGDIAQIRQAIYDENQRNQLCHELSALINRRERIARPCQQFWRKPFKPGLPVVFNQEIMHYRRTRKRYHLEPYRPIYIDFADHAAHKITERRRNRLDRRVDGKILSAVFVIRYIDRIRQKRNIRSADKDARKHARKQKLYFRLSKAKENLSHGISDSADQHDGLARNIACNLSPERRKQKVHQHHRRHGKPEHVIVKTQIHNNRRRDGMHKIGCHVENKKDDKEKGRSGFEFQLYRSFRVFFSDIIPE